jgi:glucose-6-phosphate 1-epimerase
MAAVVSTPRLARRRVVNEIMERISGKLSKWTGSAPAIYPLRHSPEKPDMLDSSKIVLTAADGARAEVFRHGAHVTSWIPAAGTERLFLSERSSFEPGAAIRGGVPVVFPQFASTGPLPKHGFARNMDWTVVEHADSRARFQLVSNAATLAIWPYAFVAELDVRVGGDALEIALDVRNTGTDPFSFTAALHTYLAVCDVGSSIVRGLQRHHYREAGVAGLQDSEPLHIDGEVDRIYFDVTRPLVVDDGEHTTEVGTRGFADVVIWNPGMQKAAALADMAPGGYTKMLCVEAAVIGTPVVLAPGDQWSGAQRLVAR